MMKLDALLDCVSEVTQRLPTRSVLDYAAFGSFKD